MYGDGEKGQSVAPLRSVIVFFLWRPLASNGSFYLANKWSLENKFVLPFKKPPTTRSYDMVLYFLLF